MYGWFPIGMYGWEPTFESLGKPICSGWHLKQSWYARGGI